MKARTYLGAAGVLAIVVVASCGGGGSSTPPTVADFCNQRAAAECEVISQCTGALSNPDCTTQRANVCTQWSHTIQSPRVFNPKNISNCVNQVKNVYSNTGVIKASDLAAVDDKCNYVFQGNVAKLMPCTVKYDCADASSICDKGVCAPQTTKNKGDDCSGAGFVCSAGSFCQKQSSGFYMCVAKGDRGATCDDTTAPCLEALRCAASTCTDPIPAGGMCTSSSQCAAAASFCDPFAAGGAACDTGLKFAPTATSCSGFTTSGVTAGTGIGVPAGGAGGAGGGSDGGGAGGSAGADAGGSG
jgi:hypothetical protein